jgi:hypothetical protein
VEVKMQIREGRTIRVVDVKRYGNVGPEDKELVIHWEGDWFVVYGKGIYDTQVPGSYPVKDTARFDNNHSPPVLKMGVPWVYEELKKRVPFTCKAILKGFDVLDLVDITPLSTEGENEGALSDLGV